LYFPAYNHFSFSLFFSLLYDMTSKSSRTRTLKPFVHHKPNSLPKSKPRAPPLTRTTLQYFVVDTVLPLHVVNDRSLFTTYAPSKRVHRTAFGTKITIEGTGNVEVRVLAGGKTILFTIHDCWHVPSSPHHFLSSLTITSPSRGHHIMLAGRTPRLLFPQQRRLAKPNLPKYVPFAREGGYFVLKFDVPAQVSKCNPITQTPPSFALQASLHHPFAGLSFHKTSMADYLSNLTHSEAALVSSKLSVPYENVSGCLGVSHPIPPPLDPLPNRDIDRLPSPRLHRDAAAPCTRTITGQVFYDSIRFHDQRKAAREHSSHCLPLPEVVANGGAVSAVVDDLSHGGTVSVVAGDLLHACGCVDVPDDSVGTSVGVVEVVTVSPGDVVIIADSFSFPDGIETFSLATTMDPAGADILRTHPISSSVTVDSDIVSHTRGTDFQDGISMFGNMEASFSGIDRASTLSTDSLFCVSHFLPFFSPLQTYPFSFPSLPFTIPTHQPLSPSLSRSLSPHNCFFPS
jgi:hypothetical protein